MAVLRRLAVIEAEIWATVEECCLAPLAEPEAQVTRGVRA